MIRLLYVIMICMFASCATLREAKDNPNRMALNDGSIWQLTGRFEPVSIVPATKKQTSFSWSIYNDGYNPQTKNDFIEIKVLNQHELRISYWDSTILIKEKVFKGRIKKDYFVFKRRQLALPFILVNVFRNRAFRVGLSPAGDIISDYKQVSFGSFYVILPFVNSEKQFNVEYKRIHKEE